MHPQGFVAPPGLPVGQATPAAGPPAPAGRLPLPGWPQKSSLEYLKLAIEVLFLVLALPWLLGNVLRRPAQVSKGAAHQHIKPS